MSYKISLVKTLVYRAYRLCSTWDNFHAEIARIKQNLVNNSFPLSVIDKQIQCLVSKLYTQSNNSTSDDNIDFYYRSFCVDSFKCEKQQLNSLIRKHVSPIDPSKTVQIHVYYKPSKLASQFSLRPKRPKLSTHKVVYQFTCPEVGCQASYIGYTTNTLETRAKQHRYSGSKIYCHFVDEHNIRPHSDLSEAFSILYRDVNPHKIKIAEALLIHSSKPMINVRYNEMSTGLKVFWVIGTYCLLLIDPLVFMLYIYLTNIVIISFPDDGLSVRPKALGY